MKLRIAVGLVALAWLGSSAGALRVWTRTGSLRLQPVGDRAGLGPGVRCVAEGVTFRQNIEATVAECFAEAAAHGYGGAFEAFEKRQDSWKMITIACEDLLTPTRVSPPAAR